MPGSGYLMGRQGPDAADRRCDLGGERLALCNQCGCGGETHATIIERL